MHQVACTGTEQKFQGVPLRIDSAIEVHPHLFHFHIGLINAPRVIRLSEMESATIFQFWCVVLYPTIDRDVIDVQSSLDYHLLQVSVAERILQIPANTEQNHLGFEVTPFERGAIVHEVGSSPSSENPQVYRKPPRLQDLHHFCTTTDCLDQYV